MKKYFCFCLVAIVTAALAVVAHAETVRFAVPGFKIVDSGDTTIGGDVSVAGDLAVAGRVTSPAVALGSITNGQVIVVSGSVMRLTATAVATNTVANPGTAYDGQVLILANVGTNNITIAKGANMALGAVTRAITPNGTLTLLGLSATRWAELASGVGNTVE